MLEKPKERIDGSFVRLAIPIKLKKSCQDSKAESIPKDAASLTLLGKNSFDYGPA